MSRIASTHRPRVNQRERDALSSSLSTTSASYEIKLHVVVQLLAIKSCLAWLKSNPARCMKRKIVVRFLYSATSMECFLCIKTGKRFHCRGHFNVGICVYLAPVETYCQSHHIQLRGRNSSLFLVYSLDEWRRWLFFTMRHRTDPSVHRFFN